MLLRIWASILVAVSLLALANAGTTFDRILYEVTFPGSWIDVSKPSLDLESFKSADGQHGFTTSFFKPSRPLTPQELQTTLSKLAEARVIAARRAYGNDVVFAAPEFSTRGDLIHVRLWGEAPGVSRIAALMIGDPQTIRAFTITTKNLDEAEFRAMATTIFNSIKLK